MLDNEAIRLRVKQVKTEYKINNLQLAKQCDVTIQTIISQINRPSGKGRGISLPVIIGLTELVPSLDARWLLTGEKSSFDIEKFGKDIAEIKTILKKMSTRKMATNGNKGKKTCVTA